MSCLLPHFNCHPDTFTTGTPPPTHRRHLILRSAAAASAAKTRHFRPHCILSPSSTPLLIFYNNNNNNNQRHKFDAWPCVAAQATYSSAESILTSEEAVLTAAASDALALAKAAAKLAKDTALLFKNKTPSTFENLLLKWVQRMEAAEQVKLSQGIQEGWRRIVRGAEKYDASKGFKFSTYAHWWIRQAVWEAVQKSVSVQYRTIRLPDLIKLEKLQEDLMEGLSDVLLTPKALESLETEIGINQSLEPSEVLADPETDDELDDPEPETDAELDDPKPETADEQLIKLLMKMDLEKVLDSLNPREKQVIRWRFGMDDGGMKTRQEIGEMMGMTADRIRQIELSALKKLKSEMRVEHLQHNIWLHNLAVKFRIFENLIKLEKLQEDLMEGLGDVLLTPKALESQETEIGISQSLEPSEVLADPETDDELDDPEPETDDELDDPKPETADEQLIKLLMKMDLEKVLDSLNPRDKQVIRWRFGMDDGRMKSLQEIGEMVGVTKERVRQIEARAFEKLESEMRIEHLQHSMRLYNLAVKFRICMSTFLTREFSF